MKNYTVCNELKKYIHKNNNDKAKNQYVLIGELCVTEIKSRQRPFVVLFPKKNTMLIVMNVSDLQFEKYELKKYCKPMQIIFAILAIKRNR